MNKTNKQRLQALDVADQITKHPLMAEHAPYSIKASNYSDKKTNGLTKCVIAFLRLNGWQAERINTMGVPKDNTKEVSNVLGQKYKIGSVEWRRTTGTKGSADISATIRGRSVKIEVKCDRDSQSDAQKAYQADIERSGGIYVISKDFDTFVEWYDNTLETL